MNEPIDVVCEGTELRRLRIGPHWHAVERVLETWVIRGAWWQREEHRLYVRLLTDRAVVEVFHQRVPPGLPVWRLARVVD